jgi:hypothetical protein
MQWGKSRVSVELLLGISATLLSLGALVVAVLQTRIAREQQHASVWPYVAIGTGRVDQKFTLWLENKGVGPALVRRVEVSYRGKPYPSPKDLFNGELSDFRGPRYFVGLGPGTVLKAGEQLLLFTIDHDARKADRLEEVAGDRGFVLRITYSDVYGNCWASAPSAVQPVRCP